MFIGEFKMLLEMFLEMFFYTYLVFLILIFLKRQLQIYNRHKILKFTQEELSVKLKEIKRLNNTLIHANLSKEQLVNDYRYVIIEIFRKYNELAVGINAGFYDEYYLKMAMKIEILLFYRRFSSVLSDFQDDTVGFLPLSFLLDRWKSESDFEFKKNVRYK